MAIPPGGTGNTMAPPIKLISTDFDGTIFAEFQNPPIPRALQTLIADLQARGARWVINTGRDMSSLLEALGRARVTIYARLPGARGTGNLPAQRLRLRQRGGLEHRLPPHMRRFLPKCGRWWNWGLGGIRFDATLYADAYSPFA